MSARLQDRAVAHVEDAYVRLTHEAGLAIITLNRPERANAVDAGMARALRGATERLSGEMGVRAVLLRAEGKMFCAGGDLVAFAAEGAGAPAYVAGVVRDLHAALEALRGLPAPVVAAVHGAAAGAGFGLAMAADIVIVGEDARFLMAYTKAGVTPDGGTSWILPRLVGLRRALDLTFRNTPVNAREALALGLVSEVVGVGALEARALQVARELASGPTAAFAGAKRLLYASLDRTYPEQLHAESECVIAAFDQRDGQEGVRAFADKRAPIFSGI
jgi:2-(1,2-epoxy-1,2-dihydrophenyl)acetyl-CoA isomerase